MMLAVLYQSANSVIPPHMVDRLPHTTGNGLQLTTGWISADHFGLYTTTDFQVLEAMPVLFFHRMCDSSLSEDKYSVAEILEHWTVSATVPEALAKPEPSTITLPEGDFSLANPAYALEVVSQLVKHAMHCGGFRTGHSHSLENVAGFIRGIMRGFTDSLVIHLLGSNVQPPNVGAE
jgi:hypothetical protein